MPSFESVSDLPTDIENHIRIHVQNRGLRTPQFFADFDKLNSGYVTGSQFFRALWENMSIKLTPSEEAALIRKYDVRNNDHMNYRLFCDVIDRPFQGCNMSMFPEHQQRPPVKYLGSKRTMRSISPQSQARLDQIMNCLAGYYNTLGLNIKDMFSDMDKHHLGSITYNQFYRGFAHPSELEPQDMELFIKKYSDPMRPDCVNYLNLHNDMLDLMRKLNEEPKSPVVYKPAYFTEEKPVPPVQEILDRMMVAMVRYGIRSVDFFADYDRLRSGLIPPSQFGSALLLCCGKEASLTPAEVEVLAGYFTAPDGNINYRDLCTILDNAYTIPNLEKKPLLTPESLVPGSLGRKVVRLTDKEEECIEEILGSIADRVKKRGLLLQPYFKDYDLEQSTTYTRLVSPLQFQRTLAFLDLHVMDADAQLLCKKFADPATGKINYPAFVQAVDERFVNYRGPTTEEVEAVVNPKWSYHQGARGDDMSQGDVLPEVVNLDALMARIRHIVLVNRRRINEGFEDFDTLNHGRVTTGQFRRVLSNIGLSNLGNHRLTDSQFSALVNHYRDPAWHDMVNWKRFFNDIDSVFTINNLELLPTCRVQPQETFLVPEPGTADWRHAPADLKEIAEPALGRLKSTLELRGITLRPVFANWDKLKHGRVSRTQFGQALAMYDIECSKEELDAICARFYDQQGVNYYRFLDIVEPQVEVPYGYLRRLKDIRLTNVKRVDTSTHDISLDEILTKIKEKVYKERVSLKEWLRDHDKLRSGIMNRTTFRRGIDLCRLNLSQAELDMIEDFYRGPEAETVDHKRFCEDIESIFTTANLEKTPKVVPEDFEIVTHDKKVDGNASMESCRVGQECFYRIVKEVRRLRPQLHHFFEDFDKIHTGRVTRSQFERAIGQLGLAHVVFEQSDWKALCDLFAAKSAGSNNDVNYLAFCDSVYALTEGKRA